MNNALQAKRAQRCEFQNKIKNQFKTTVSMYYKR